jgi:hypothetical protein
VTVSDIVRLYARNKDDVETLKRAIALDELPESWRKHFREQLAHVKQAQ